MVFDPLQISPSARTTGTGAVLCEALGTSRRGEPRKSKRGGLKVDVDFTLPFGRRRWRWVAVSRGEAEGATFISSCTHVRFLAALRFYRKQQEVGSGGGGGGPKRKITVSLQENMLRKRRKVVIIITALRLCYYYLK